MKIRLMQAVSAAALSLALAAGAAGAQDLGLKQLQDSATSSFAKLGLDTTPIDTLTIEELSQIQSVSNSSDADQTKIGRIETILRDADERIATGGATEPTGVAGDVRPEDLKADLVTRENVGAYVAQLGLAEQVKVDALTTDQVSQIQLVQSSDDSVDVQRERIEEIVGIQ
jgi:hypothetical protein